MISVDQALQKIMARLPECRPTECMLSNSVGHILAEDVQSDIDSPPYDKSLVDGYAVLAEDVKQDVVPAKVKQNGDALEMSRRSRTWSNMVSQ